MPRQQEHNPSVVIVDRLVSGSARSEATIQADVRALLLTADLDLDDVHLETPVGAQQRIDVEVGATVIEVKKSLASETAREKAREQLTTYVTARSTELGTRYVGILTDGIRWLAYHEVDGDLVEATRHEASGGHSGTTALLLWLEGVLATKQDMRPVPSEIRERLGAASSSHALDFSTLSALYEANRTLPTVQLKRELWAKLLGEALGTQFSNDDDLFLEHTLLVNSAEIIAHLVVGLRAGELAPATLLSGDLFTSAGLHGVVDRDFFDWVLEVPEGEAFVAALARRLARFDWSAVEHDVLKVLYESVIPSTTRKSLGEYYTPDWLAHEVVAETVTDPLNQRVLDPSCGSGSFLFYAVRRYLSAADDAGWSLAETMHTVSSRVMGIDLHPVAVALARVTYLLALGRERLASPERGELSVPVYLGDSLGWDRQDDLLSVGYLVIATEAGDQLLSGELRFSDHLLSDAARFDDLVSALVEESGRAAAAGRKTSRLSDGTKRRLALSDADVADLAPTFARLRELHEADRNHIWSYYIRNVARPEWLSRNENRVDVLVGNPPWLSYRHMSDAMQATFKEMARERGFWADDATATHQDLAGVFIARAVERYLADGGQFGFVVPNPVVDRDYWAGFRSGKFGAGTLVAFAPSWDLRRVRPHLFPRGSAVVFGRRITPEVAQHGKDRNVGAVRMPLDIEVWSGKAPAPHALAGGPLESITRTPGQAVIRTGGAVSAYGARFAQGATLVPRLLYRVESDSPTGLGAPAGRRAIRSQRSVSEKKPWKDLPTLAGTVESQFVWPTVLGEHLLPFRILPPSEFVLPLTSDGTILAPDGDTIDRWRGLATWMRQADELWRRHSAGKMTVPERLDHMKGLSHQIPMPSTRVVYSKAGMHVTAAVLQDTRAVVDHTMYWAAASSPDEATYLVGILNAPSLTDLVRPYMSYGKDERHVDKSVWKLPIPTYDPDNLDHVRLVQLAEKLTDEIAAMEFDTTNFVTQRRRVREYLAASPSGKEVDALVTELVQE
ncbi:N-6 DNA methylase [Promicromonospora sp. NPDC059942]|uniref:N-6 DNA methylase n=1 Tax=Promicromonospora sp. NPDC059942 TaxID=3347009 RepID=UPI00365B5A1B